jgi:hypothetical protein
MLPPWGLGRQPDGQGSIPWLAPRGGESYEVGKMETTIEAQKTIAWLKQYTSNWPQIEACLETMLERHEAEIVTSGLIAYAVKNAEKLAARRESADDGSTGVIRPKAKESPDKTADGHRKVYGRDTGWIRRARLFLGLDVW